MSERFNARLMVAMLTVLSILFTVFALSQYKVSGLPGHKPEMPYITQLFEWFDEADQRPVG